MLFNSFSFLFLYLPLVLAGFFVLGRTSPRWAAVWLGMASLAFYGVGSARHVPLLLASIMFNFAAARAITHAAGTARRRVLLAAVAANLALLAYYKYANFFLGAVGAQSQLAIILPVGISFFTFTQIAFLVDCHRREASEVRFSHYFLFVSYFPHLVAGPVLHHKEMMPQFADARNYRPLAANFAIGMSIFVVGLAKKVLIADNLSPLAGPVFAAGAHPQMIEAWVGVLAYTFQLYFDFSGYSDMAIGLSRMFGVKLPLNFNAPHKALDIGAFWRRWHMTLSRFLRDYLYIALGGGRLGRLKRYRNLMLTMLLGGLWHGAGWTFVAWGALHGGFLVLHHCWQAWGGFRLAPLAAQALTFLAVMLAWVFFRAPDFGTAFDILGALAGANGVSLPRAFAPLAQWLPGAVGFDGLRWIELVGLGLPALALAAVLAFFAPTTQEIFCHYEPAFERILHRPARQWITWRPRPAWGLGFAGLFIVCVLSMNRVSEFLYFQF
ncbi:MBOAT family O-acyltransferase [Massilia glaciei]|uniref:Probable alginate O-acetylase AlgI n=1 Tax=Massilia glaciei TaxID=1524097 RepID=A0A2U2HJH1_9BURK|nr:MBOAT family O-acyltransferase [Massilia glaciei]PWF47650.1 MBOAT family protein [Massilia glaciei]